MDIQPPVTESVVRTHLQAFLEQRGIAAILGDYAEDALLVSEDRTYRGRRDIGTFFVRFIASLPPQGIDRFSLRSLRVAGDVAHITWSIGSEWPLGTDTFVVRNGKIVSQTFAMYATEAS
ncbi:MAG TPA: nuclear transport factor 2 family protein [Casimicrobiaceae bacterium]|jgi:ketosteroid isomerase-like protein